MGDNNEAYEEAAHFDANTRLPSTFYAALGESRRHAGQYATALSAYSDALAGDADPYTLSRVLAARAQVRYAMGDHAGSMDDCHAALAATDDDQSKARVLVTMVGAVLGSGVGLITAADVYPSAAFVAGAASIAPEIAALLRPDGPLFAAQTGDPRHAATARIRRAARAAVRVLRGGAYEDAGDLDAAADEYEAANDQVATAVAHARCGRCDWKRRRHPQAIAAYEAAVRCAVANAKIARRILWRALRRRDAGYHRGAMDDLDWAIGRGLAPIDQADAHLAYSGCLAALGDPVGAITRAHAAIDNAPGTWTGRSLAALGHFTRATLWELRGDHAAAAADYRAATETMPSGRRLTAERRSTPDYPDTHVEAAALHADPPIAAAVMVACGRWLSLSAPEKALEHYDRAAAIAAETDHPGVFAAARSAKAVARLASEGSEALGVELKALAEIGIDKQEFEAARRFGERFERPGTLA